MNSINTAKPSAVLNIFKQTLTLLVLTSVLQGCVWVAAGAVAVTAIDFAYDRRTTGTYVDDGAVELKIKRDVSFDPRLKGSTHISITSVNGIVLLTGETPTAEQKALAEKIARLHPEVRQVVNELELGGKTGLGSRSSDAWLNSKVKTQLMRVKEINSTHVNVVTERGNVYLMGLVTKSEAEAAVNAARSVGGVVRIIKVFEYI